MEKLELRAYFLCGYWMSGIQKGIQAGHSLVEYQLKYPNCEKYLEWAQNHKTMILLCGGTSNNISMDGSVGSMEQYIYDFELNGIDFANFKEPDQNNSNTAICWMVDERVFNTRKYPNFEKWCKDNALYLTNENRSKWVEFIGGSKNEFLRTFNKFNLASN